MKNLNFFSKFNYSNPIRNNRTRTKKYPNPTRSTEIPERVLYFYTEIPDPNPNAPSEPERPPLTKTMLHGQQTISSIGNQHDKSNQEHANIIYSRQEIYILHPVAEA